MAQPDGRGLGRVAVKTLAHQASLNAKQMVPCSLMGQIAAATGTFTTATTPGAGTGLLLEFRLRTEVSGQGLYVEWGNWGKSSGSVASRWQEGGPGNANTIEISYYDWASSTWLPLKETVTNTAAFSVPDGQTALWYAPCWVYDGMYIRIRLTTSGLFICGQNAFNNPTAGTRYSLSATPAAIATGAPASFSNSTLTGSTSDSGFLTFPFGFYVGRPATTKTIIPVILFGDSIMAGTKEGSSDFDLEGSYYNGFTRRAIHAYNQSQSDVILVGPNFGISGDQMFYNAPDAVPSAATATFGSKEPWLQRTLIAQRVAPRMMFVMMGRNDANASRSEATFKASCLAFCTRMRAMGVEKLIGFAPCPETTTTNLYVSAAVQTQNSNGVALTTWAAAMLADPAGYGFDHVVDTRAFLGDASDRTKWANGGSVTLTVSSGTTGNGTTAAYLTGTGVNDLTTTGRYFDYVLTVLTGPNAGQVQACTRSDLNGGFHRLFGGSNWTNAFTAGDTIQAVRRYTNDGVHPNEWGNMDFGAYLAPLIGQYLP